MYLIDTNIFGYLQKGDAKVIDKFSSIDPDLIFISSIVWAEMIFGTYLYPDSKNFLKLKQFYNELSLTAKFVNFDKNCAQIFARLKIENRNSGKNIADFDLMIATQAIANNLILVTNNTKDFVNIPDLKVEDWTK